MEAFEALKQVPWQVHIGVLSLIFFYALDLKVFAKKKVGRAEKIEMAKARGHVTKGMVVKEEAHRVHSRSYWGAHYTYTVAGRQYRKKFSSDPRTSTGPKLRTIINVYWIDDPNHPFWDYSEDPAGTWYSIFITLFPIAGMIFVIWILGGFDAITAMNR